MELRAEGISRQFLRQGKGTNILTAVEETSLTLSPGRLTEVVGKSGSGKSTLLMMLAGLLTPTRGTVSLEEQDLYALSEDARARLRHAHIGIIPQGQTTLRSLTVLENILLPTRLYSDQKADREKAEQLMEEVGIADLAHAFPDALSGGERRRLAIARACMMRPEILLADEPTADLDEENTETVLRLLRRRADAGTAVFLVTHEREAAAYADQVLTMQNGVLR